MKYFDAIVFAFLVFNIVTLLAMFVGFKLKAMSIADIPLANAEKLKEKICYFGMNNLLEDKITKEFFVDEAFAEIKGQLNPLDSDSGQYVSSRMSGDRCQFVIEEPKGLRAFSVEVVEAPNRVLGYGIRDITETEIEQKEVEK